MTRLPDQDFGYRHALVLGFMREHGTRDHIADRPDARHVCCVIMIDGDAAALVALDAHRVEPKPVGVRHAADRHQHHIRFDNFRRTAFGRLNLCFQAFAGGVDRGHLRRQLERHALFLEQALRLAAHFAVHAG